MSYYQSVHNCVDVEDQIPPTLPCLPAGRLYKREESPLFGKEGPFDRAHGHELVEWLGEIFTTICLFNYGLLSKRRRSQDSSQYFPKKTQPFGWALFFRSPLLPVSFRSLASLIIPPERFYPFSLLIRFAGSEISIFSVLLI